MEAEAKYETALGHREMSRTIPQAALTMQRQRPLDESEEIVAKIGEAIAGTSPTPAMLLRVSNGVEQPGAVRAHGACPRAKETGLAAGMGVHKRCAERERVGVGSSNQESRRKQVRVVEARNAEQRVASSCAFSHC